MYEIGSKVSRPGLALLRTSEHAGTNRMFYAALLDIRLYLSIDQSRRNHRRSVPVHPPPRSVLLSVCAVKTELVIPRNIRFKWGLAIVIYTFNRCHWLK